MTEPHRQKLCFVAHEFGFFPGHGGVAAYLHNTVRLLVEHGGYEVHVIAGQNNPNDPLLEHFHFHRFHYDDRKQVLALLEKIQPDFVELTDYLSFGYRALVKKALGLGLTNTTFVVNHHTNVKECFEWSEEVPFRHAAPGVRLEHELEKAKYFLADKNIVPSRFLGHYVRKHYGITDSELFRYPYDTKVKNRAECAKVSARVARLPQSDFTITCIARFEGRKKQDFLVQQFLEFRRRSGINAHLHLVGNSVPRWADGADQMQTVYNAVPEEARSFVHFHDFMSLQQQESLLGITDLYVLPSTFENFPFSVLDTIYRGIPVMCSRYCGIADVLGSTHGAMAFDPFSENDLAQKLEGFYRLPPSAREAAANEQLRATRQETGPQALEHKLRNLVSIPVPFAGIDIGSMPRVVVTERTANIEATGETLALLSAEPEPALTAFAETLSVVSAKLREAVLVFHRGTPPLDIPDALQQGMPLALVGHRFAEGRLPFKQCIAEALARKHMVPVEMSYTPTLSQHFYRYAIRCLERLDPKEMYHE